MLGTLYHPFEYTSLAIALRPMAAVYPVPPPTTNTLDPVQRKRLLKSTQKLGALLGATPRVLEPGSALPPLTPGTRAFRREGKVFYNHSASSSTTSVSSSDAEGFVWVPSPTEVPLKQHHKNVSTPIAIELPPAAAKKAVSPMAGHKKSKSSQQHSATAPQQLSQPLLYRLRAVPIPPPIVSPPPTPQKISPLSPLSPTFTVPAKTTVNPKARNELSESDRRRKMAKLTRTLGENIPPELVFGPPPRSTSLLGNSTVTNAAAPAAPTMSRRKRSVTPIHRPTASTSPLESEPLNDIPPVPVLSTEKKSGLNSANKATVNTGPSPSKQFPPTPVITITTTTITTTGATTTVTTDATTTRRKHRPRSLTLTHIPIGQHRNVVVDQDQSARETGRGHSRSLDEPERVTAARRKEALAAAASASTANLVDYGKRKERDWSGEWNVKDMEDVVKALRGLRVQ